MTNQSISAGSTANLIASNFSRAGYGFTGWNTAADGTGTQYGPNQNITMPSSGGITLFAQWLAPSGTFQTWNGASSMEIGDVIALSDNRDGEVYMVSKLADNKIWITENLRLVPSTATITTRNTNNPTANFIAAAPSSSSTTQQCSSDDTECVNQINYNAHNLDRSLTPAYNGATNATYWYSYGVMYNWYTATAGNGNFAMTSGNTAGDLCPAGWHMPTGGSSGEWGVLADSMAGNNGTAKSATLRSYPNNFLYSGDYNPQKNIPDGVGKQGRFWSTTPVSSNTKNAYRMGYNADGLTPATSNSWNKWDNFAIRCIYQGGNIHYADVTVNFAGTGVTSLTFTSPGQDTETVTPQDPTVNLVQDVTYTVTATLSNGYEVASWASSPGGTLGDTTTINPAVNPNTYIITSDETTLTATGQETPSYAVTTTLGENITSLSFTNPNYGTTTTTPASESCTDNHDGTYTCIVNLYRGVDYTTTATFTEGYTIDTWTAGTGSTVSDSSANPTTYTITSASTLSVTATEITDLTYTLIYDATPGTDAPESDTATTPNLTQDFTITNSAPIYYGYTFLGWSETSGATTPSYVSGDTITITSTGATTTSKTLYAVYQANNCPANKICYYDNGADVTGGGRGTMNNQSTSSSTSANLIPSNYSKTGYGFAGWDTVTTDTNNNNAIIPSTTYGPNATITTPDTSTSGLALYAKWVKSEGDLQSWRGCNAMTTNQVIALTDTRDNNVYAVAKLADDNCWTVENLRLDPGIATITTNNTHNPTQSFITNSNTDDGSGNVHSLSLDTLCKDKNSTCFDQIQYNSNSTNRNLTQSYNGNTNAVAWYAYGTYYNWYTATAGHGTYDTTDNATVTGDICPKNWHIPTGNTGGEYETLNTVVNSGSDSSDTGLRAYPVNFVWSGDYNNTNRKSSYSNGRIWTSTAKTNIEAYRVGYASNNATLSTNSYEKWDGFVIRCMRDEAAAEYSDVTVTLPQNVTSITFENTKYGTETATTSNPTVSLAENATYTITANIVIGYELDEWTAGQNTTIGSTTQNPTTIIITDDSTLTLSVNQIPSYQVTVNFTEGVSSIGIYNEDYGTIQITPATATDNHDGTYTATATLYNNIPYTISSSYTGDYTIDHWSTTENGTLASTTTKATTYTVTGTATLTLTSKQKSGQTTLLPGEELNTKMKTLAEGTSTSYDTSSSKIKALRMADSLPEGFTPSSANTVSVDGSEKPIYIFFDNTNNAGIMYFYTDAKDIYMNSNSSYAFYFNTALTDISALSTWNTSSVTDMSGMFWYAYSLTNIDALANWDTSSVTDMGAMFDQATTLTNIDALANWDVSNVTNMQAMFFETSLTNIDALANWNTSSVTNMNGMFSSTSSLTNIDALANWNTSSVTNMGNMFSYTSSLTNIDALANWDVSSVTNMSDMFYYATALTNIDALANWDTSSVTNMSGMFERAYALTNASGADNWDIRNVKATAGSSSSSSNNFYRMFYNAGSSSTSAYHPNFTMRSGTWNNAGTFIPGDTTPVPVTTTVNFDSHISNIQFYGVFPGSSSETTQTISTSGSTISLNSSDSYRITATLSSGYELALWDPGEHGVIPANRLTINSRTNDYTNFTPIGDTTLTATSQPISSDVTTTVNMDSNVTRVSFCNDKYNTYNSSTHTYDCAIATTNASTVTLKQGVTYKVTTKTNSGYEVSSYTATGAMLVRAVA